MSELDFEVAEMSSPEIIDLTIENSEESGDQKMDAFKVQNSSEIISDLEEGEIKEPDNSVCRHFRRGRCWLGKNCTFLHVGLNSYNMFDSQNSLPVIVYQPIILDQPTKDDAWDKGLREAKNLLLKAKLKKEADLDFEEKQLYQGLDEITGDHKDFYSRKIDLANRHRKQRKTSDDCSRLKNSKPEPKNLKSNSKELPCSRKHEKVKAKTRNSRSNSWSPVPPRHHRKSNSSTYSSSSSCSRCKASCDESEHDIRKSKSKLERVFSRTFDSPKTSRKETTFRRSYSSYPRRRSLSRHSFMKRFIYRSYSKSPSPIKKESSRKRPEKNEPHKPLYTQPTSPKSERLGKYSPSYSKKERSSSPFSKLLSQNNVLDLGSCSSDMTVSSIKCTSVSTSCVSSEKKESTRPTLPPVIISRKLSNDVEHKREHINDINKWLDSVPKSTKGSQCESKISTKIVEREKEKSSKPVENIKTLANLNPKLSSCSSSTDEEFSADELELLRYIPNKNRNKPGQHKKKAKNNVKVTIPAPKTSVKRRPQNKENHSTKTNAEYPPPKIVYDHGSDSESIPPKLVHGCGSDRQSYSQKSVGSNRASPTRKTLAEHLSPKNILDHETNGENNFPKESNNVERVNDSFSKKLNDTAKCPLTEKIDDAGNDFYPRTNESKKRRSSESSVEQLLSKDELELLKYVSIRHPGLSEEIRKQTIPPKQKTISRCDDSKTSKRKTAGQKKVKTTELSRREQLMQQLEAVELAIAEKKRQVKLENAKLLKKKRKSLN